MKDITSVRIPVLVLLLLFISACARNTDGTWKAPFVYRIDVQQGNVVDQEMINKLQPGMDKIQVKFIMGTPLITDSFHSDRWDYIYSMEPGKGERQQRRVTLYFRNEKLAYVDGDIKVNAFPAQETETDTDVVVDVPLEQNREGFFSRMFNKEKPATGQVEEAAEQAPETALTEEGDKQGSETALTEETGTEAGTGTEPIETTTGSSTAPADTTASPSPDQAVTDTATASGSTIEPEHKKNLFKRFWDRITTGATDSTIEQGEESERDRRDAEVLESAGGQL